MKRIDDPVIDRPDGNGLQIELPGLGIMLTVQQQDDGYIRGNIALMAKPIMVVDFHTHGDDWNIHQYSIGDLVEDV